MVTQEWKDQLTLAIARANESVKTILTLRDGVEWRPTFEHGKSKAILRVLPVVNSTGPIFSYHRHKIGWNGHAPQVNERCPRDKGAACPFCNAADQLRPFMTVDRSVHDLVKTIESKEVQVINVYVVDDQNAPYNNDRVMFMYMRRGIGKAIQGAIKIHGSSMFDPVGGLTLVVVGSSVNSRTNYSRSYVMDTGKPMAATDEESATIIQRARSEDQMRLSLNYPSPEVINSMYESYASKVVEAMIQKLTDNSTIKTNVFQFVPNLHYDLPTEIKKVFDDLSNAGYDNFMLKQRTNLFTTMKSHGMTELSYDDTIKYLTYLTKQVNILNIDIPVEMPTTTLFNFGD